MPQLKLIASVSVIALSATACMSRLPSAKSGHDSASETASIDLAVPAKNQLSSDPNIVSAIDGIALEVKSVDPECAKMNISKILPYNEVTSIGGEIKRNCDYDINLSVGKLNADQSALASSAFIGHAKVTKASSAGAKVDVSLDLKRADATSQDAIPINIRVNPPAGASTNGQSQANASEASLESRLAASEAAWQAARKSQGAGKSYAVYLDAAPGKLAKGVTIIVVDATDRIATRIYKPESSSSSYSRYTETAAKGEIGTHPYGENAATLNELFAACRALISAESAEVSPFASSPVEFTIDPTTQLPMTCRSLKTGVTAFKIQRVLLLSGANEPV